MKNIILTLAILLTLSCKAQSPIIDISSDYQTEDIVDNCYFKDVQNKFAPYVGTWKWINGNNSLEITIQKVELVYENLGKYYSDYLIGKYKYTENGIVIINTLDYVINSSNAWNSHPAYTNNMLTPMLGSYQSDYIAKFTFADYLKNKNEKMKFELLDFLPDGTVTQAKIKLSNSEHWNIDGQNPRDPDFTIPNNITLTKQ